MTTTLSTTNLAIAMRNTVEPKLHTAVNRMLAFFEDAVQEEICKWIEVNVKTNSITDYDIVCIAYHLHRRIGVFCEAANDGLNTVLCDMPSTEALRNDEHALLVALLRYKVMQFTKDGSFSWSEVADEIATQVFDGILLHEAL